jgi:uncharacterized protein YdcH (DUF465 family)
MKEVMQARDLNDLEERHRSLDSAVTRLERRAYLTPSEQLTMTNLKKEKLLTKDRIAALRRE